MNAIVRHGAALAAVVLGLGVVGVGCLTRPIEHSDPVTQTNVTLHVPNQVIDKIDLLFDIDNSASMGDKQSYLQQAIPDLIDRLVNPRCIDSTQTPPAVVGKAVNGQCAAGKAEFPAVHDMHIGIVTSSLGSRLTDKGTDPTTKQVVDNICPEPYPGPGTVDAHNDDKGHLVARQFDPTAMTESPVADAAIAAYGTNSGFLYWFPGSGATGPAKPLTAVGAPGMLGTLEGDFSAMVGGAGVYGCGIESQLESWYRFLIQPDPYATLKLTSNNLAAWDGVDDTILQERKDFLRPDSLVAIVVLSDENDSEIDTRSLGGQGYKFMQLNWSPPHGTTACLTDPASAACQSCNDPKDPACVACPTSGAMPPNCGGSYSSRTNWGYDVNLRHVHMKEKYGLDPQYPIGRYFLGLTQESVPDRVGEYQDPTTGKPTSGYTGVANCVNPLFAAGPLPASSKEEVCKLTLGPRANQKNLVFYAHIGGVPYQLLHFKDNDAAASKLTDADWVRILGKSAASYDGRSAMTFDYNGIDPHMIEDYRDRTTVSYPFSTDSSMTNPLSSANSPSGSDKTNGREWVTDQEIKAQTHRLPVDRQYACTFPLATPRDCANTANNASCDCPLISTGLTAAETPPLCDDANTTSQKYAKAYPTIRELLLARLMKDQGIVSSICPQHVREDAAGDPYYGYRPAVASIVDRLKTALNSACLPQKLQVDSQGVVPCLILVTLPANLSGNGTCKNPTCDESKGLYAPNSKVHPWSQAVLDKFCDDSHASYVAGGGISGGIGDPLSKSVCELVQLTQMDTTASVEFDTTGSCSSSTVPGWCYVTGRGTKCAQAIEFAKSSPPPGSFTTLQCIEKTISVVGTTGDGG